MAKDTRGLPKNEVTKKDIENKQAASDEKIIAEGRVKPLTNADGQRVEGPVPFSHIVEANKAVEEGNKARMADLPASGGPVKDAPAVPDPFTPKPTIEELTPGQEARRAARNVGTAIPSKTTTLDFGRLPSRSEGSSKGAEVNVTEKPDVAINIIDRLKSGMGLPGEEQGHIDRALSLHERDRQVAIRTGKTVNGIQPNESKATPISVFGGHHHRLAKVMHTFGIADEDVYRSAASASGQRLETYVHGLHKIAQEHEDSKRQITHTPKEGDLWEHKSTKELIPVAANHPDMPMAFTRTKGKVARVTRGAGGEEVIQRSHEGWDSIKVAGGKTVYRQYSAPTGVDLVDHLRVQMLSEHGPSTTSRKKGADIATQMADTVSGKVPKGMVKVGTRKVGKRAAPNIIQKPGRAGSVSYQMQPNTVETTVPVFAPKPQTGPRAGKKPNPPKASTGTVLKGIVDLDVPVPVRSKRKTPAENMQENLRRGGTYSQQFLPGTGEPKRISVETKPAVMGSMQGPLTQDQMSRVDLSVPVPAPRKGSGAEQILEQGEPPSYNPAAARKKRDEARSKIVYDKKDQERLDGSYSKVSFTTSVDAKGKKTVSSVRGSTRVPIEKESDLRSVVVKPAETVSELVPTDREWKRQNPNIGRQFSGIDTTDMTGAEELKALSKARAFVHQQPSPSRDLVVRPGGKAQAKRDRKKPAPAAPEQLSLFPDYSVKEGRSNAFYMAGSVEPISEASKSLQAQAKKPLGSKEVEPVVSGSRSEKKLNDQINKA